ncbi:hypothetical protein IJT93_10505 [bacterium]|nr:hypothetical protein [bacterium]
MHRFCEECGAGMEWFRRGGCCGWECKSCGWNVATSWFDPIEMDQTAYSISLEPSENPAVSKLKLTAEIAGVNWLEAKKLIENAPAELFRGPAPQIKEIRDKLEAAGMKYKIEPEFPY